MNDRPPMFDTGFTSKLLVLLVAGFVGTLAQLARLLTGDKKPTAFRFLGGLLGSGVAAFSTGALLINSGASDLVVLGTSGPVGWLGGSFLSALATLAERKLGINGKGKEEQNA